MNSGRLFALHEFLKAQNLLSSMKDLEKFNKKAFDMDLQKGEICSRFCVLLLVCFWPFIRLQPAGSEPQCLLHAVRFSTH